MSEKTTGIAEAVRKAGGQIKLAQLLGVTQQAVSEWERKGWVPPGRVVEIETQFGIPRARLISPRLIDLVEPPVGEVGVCD